MHPDHHALMCERSLAVRQAWSRLKRDLKSGRVGLRAALDHDAAQNRSVLEVLGYALIGQCLGDAWTHNVHRRVPCAGAWALDVARTVSLGHFTQVADLSGDRRDQLALAAAHSRYATAATVDAPLSAVS